MEANILQNLSPGGCRVAAEVLILVHVFFAFLLISNPIYQEMEELFRVPPRQSSSIERPSRSIRISSAEISALVH